MERMLGVCQEQGLIAILGLGAQFDPELTAGRMTMREMWTKSWTVNTVGTQIMTHTFVPLLLKSSDPRLLFITSGTSTLAGTENLELLINKVPAKGWPKNNPRLSNFPAYRSSKAGMNMMMRYPVPNHSLSPRHRADIVRAESGSETSRKTASRCGASRPAILPPGWVEARRRTRSRALETRRWRASSLEMSCKGRGTPMWAK